MIPALHWASAPPLIPRQLQLQGAVPVTAEFRNAPDGVTPVAGATRAITRLRGVFLSIEGAGRVKLTHTPFTIGRGRDCDLTLMDMAVSRKHAVIEGDQHSGLVVRDLGSRNLIGIDGAAVAALKLEAGMAFTLGGTTITLEVSNER